MYTRDLNTKFLINNDDSEYLKILKLREKNKKDNEINEKINKLENEISEIKELLLQIIKG